MIDAESLRRGRSSVLAIALALACSQKAPLPPNLGDCEAGTKCGSTGGIGSGTGSGTGGASGDGGTCGTIMYLDPICNTCVQQNCCGDDSACSDDPLCLDIVRCASACAPSDQTCILNCENQWQNGVANYQNFTFCTQSRCMTECAVPEGGASCGVSLFSSMACNVCITTNCCNANAACSNNPDCFALVQCVSACPANDQVCQTNCQATHPNSGVDYTNLNQCRLASCSSKCQ